MKEVYKSRVYTDRPAYADFDAPDKFQAINSYKSERMKLDRKEKKRMGQSSLFGGEL